MPPEQVLRYTIPAIIALFITIVILKGWYKKIFNKRNASAVTKSGSKIGKDLVKSGSKTVTQIKEFKPVWPGGIEHSNKQPETVTVPAVIPKQHSAGVIEVINPKPQFSPDRYVGMIELVYTPSCGDLSLHEEYDDGSSIAFHIVAEWDKKNRRYRAWLYDPHPHVDTRKSNKQKHNDYGQFERSY